MRVKRLFFILPDLNAGGAQRVVTFLSKNIAQNFFEVKLIIIGAKNKTAFDLELVDVVYLGKSRLLKSIPTLISIFNKEKPDIVFSSIGNLNVVLGMLAIFYNKINFIAREASVVSNRAEYSSLGEKIYGLFLKLSYKNFSKIVCQSTDMKKDFIENFSIPSEKLVLINNPITELVSVGEKIKTTDKMMYITVGRLTEIKGHLRILHCLSKISNYEFEYTIVGSGNLKSKILETAEKLNLENKIVFIPFTSNVLKELSKHHFFLQGSYVEGFPNALLESCSVGVPGIAFNVPGGTKEIIQNGENGFLVENECEFIEVICDLDKLNSLKNCSEIKKSVELKFNANKILREYLELFDDVLNKK
ncbi:glycosyltransferase [Wenyingzhuangia sp. IMCC45533]